jgi:hypothetical protein
MLTTPDQPYNSTSGPSTDQRTLETYRNEIETIVADDLPAGYGAVAVLIMSHYSRTMGLDFHNGVKHGTNMAGDDPRFVLREFLKRPQNNAQAAISRVAKTISAADAFIHSEPLKRLSESRERYQRFCGDLDIAPNRSFAIYLL